MFVFIDKSIHDRGSPHRLSLAAETPGDEKLLQQLVDSYTLAGCGMDPETNNPVHVSIAMEALIEIVSPQFQDTADHFEKFVGFAATCRRENTDEWLRLFLVWLNRAAMRLDPDSYFALCGDDHFELRRFERKADD